MELDFKGGGAGLGLGQRRRRKQRIKMVRVAEVAIPPAPSLRDSVGCPHPSRVPTGSVSRLYKDRGWGPSRIELLGCTALHAAAQLGRQADFPGTPSSPAAPCVHSSHPRVPSDHTHMCTHTRGSPVLVAWVLQPPKVLHGRSTSEGSWSHGYRGTGRRAGDFVLRQTKVKATLKV